MLQFNSTQLQVDEEQIKSQLQKPKKPKKPKKSKKHHVSKSSEVATGSDDVTQSDVTMEADDDLAEYDLDNYDSPDESGECMI